MTNYYSHVVYAGRGLDSQLSPAHGQVILLSPEAGDDEVTTVTDLQQTRSWRVRLEELRDLTDEDIGQMPSGDRVEYYSQVRWNEDLKRHQEMAKHDRVLRLARINRLERFVDQGERYYIYTGPGTLGYSPTPGSPVEVVGCDEQAIKVRYLDSQRVVYRVDPRQLRPVRPEDLEEIDANERRQIEFHWQKKDMAAYR